MARICEPFFIEQGLVGGHGEGVHDKAKEGVEPALLGPLTEVAVAESGCGEDILRLAAELGKVLLCSLLSRRGGG